MSFYEVNVPWSIRLANRWGHWSAQMLAASVLGAIWLALRPPPPDDPLALEAPLLLLVFVLMSWYFMRQHDRRLCESCMSSMPLNASETASRYRRRLAIAHLASNRRLTIAYLVVLIASTPLLLGLHLMPTGISQVAWAAIQMTMIYLVLSYSTHRKLQPWCPQCQGGDGDDHEVDAPDPVPTGSNNV